MRIELEPAQADGIWRKLNHVNLTGAHRHNFRDDYSIVGGWRRWLTNAYLGLLRESGLLAAASALGCEKGGDLDAREDEDLFNIFFNKSNLYSGRFGFEHYGGRVHTRVERSSFTLDGLVVVVWEVAGPAGVVTERRLDTLIAALSGAAG